MRQNNKYLTIAAAVVMAVLISACGPKSMYEWDGYSSHLLSYYKHPEELDNFSKKMLKSIEKAEETNNVPPGIYAEYGYAMLALDDASTAAIFFSKEKEKWPESTYLMDKILGKISNTPTAETPVASNNTSATGETK